MMLNPLTRGLACVSIALMGWALSADAIAEEPTIHAVMTVDEMCGGCVAKITKRFDGVTGIAEVRCDIKSKSVTVFPAKGYVLNLRGLWEAMEEIGKTPTKLVGPGGTYTSKPKK